MDRQIGICGHVRALHFLVLAVVLSFTIAAGCRVQLREADPNDPDVEWFDPEPEIEQTVPEDAAE
jgi:hypothetical protein